LVHVAAILTVAAALACAPPCAWGQMGGGGMGGGGMGGGGMGGGSNNGNYAPGSGGPAGQMSPYNTSTIGGYSQPSLPNGVISGPSKKDLLDEAKEIDQVDPNNLEQVIDVRVVGSRAVPLQRIVPEIKTRAGRPYNPQSVEDDVRRLTKSRNFVSVDTSIERKPEGVVIIYRLVERPTLKYLKFVGNKVMDRTCRKQTGLKVGDSLDPYMVTEGKRKLEEWYATHGYGKARVTILEGDKPGDSGAVYLINEGTKQRVYKVEFVGNAIASDARLRTQVKSKHPLLYIFKGEVDRDKIDHDVDLLTTYYRSLGFFRARIGREMIYNEKENWLTLQFVIDEGPRYKIRDVALIGNKHFSGDDMKKELKLAAGQYFDKHQMDRDVAFMQDKYGGIGYIFAAVEGEPRFLEEAGQLDLVYQVQEGDRYRVGRIDVHIAGDHPRTRRHTILNRLSLYPGDIADVRELRDSERRLKASGMFINKPQDGKEPKVVFKQPGLTEENADGNGESATAGRQRRGRMRGQSPDDTDELASRVWTPPPGCTDKALVLEVDDTGALLDVAAAPTVVRAQSPDPIAPTAVPWQTARPQWQDPPPSMPGPAPLWRGQSPVGGQPNSWAGAGQVAMGRTDPDALNTPVVQAGGATGQYGRPTNVVQTQYTQPGAYPGATAAPGMTPPPYVNPAYATPAQPGYAAGQAPYGAPQSYPQGQPNYPPGQSPYPAGQAAYQAGLGYQQQPTTGGALPPPTTAPSQLPQYNAPVYTSPTAPQASNGQYAPPTQSLSPPGSAPPGGVPPPAGYDDPNQLAPRNGYPFLDDDTNNLREAPVLASVEETQTGRFMVGVGVNSSAGLMGSVTVEEQNFDWKRVPTSFEDIRSGTAFRGAGQNLRLEAMPGTVLSRYSATFREPYLWDTRINFATSLYYFQRYYTSWTERRAGGTVSFGYQFTPDLSGVFTLRGEDVKIDNQQVPTPPELLAVLGHTQLYTAKWAMIHDTRDSTFLPTQGHYVNASFEQAFATFTFPRGIIDARQHFLLHERPDRSGRQTLSFLTTVGVSGSSTPLYENFFAGGYQTLRGFYFRGASPQDMNVFVGGHFEWINTVEYMFPITADDMLRGVVFCDFGTVEPTTELKAKDYRVSPGAGLRITIPAMGPAPIALDLAAPVTHAYGDLIQNFSFFVGYAR
jgi:outer membrane protein insertion porin family